MRNWYPLYLSLVLLSASSRVCLAQDEQLITEPDSVLLFAWGYGDILLSTPTGNLNVRGPDGGPVDELNFSPALAPGGDLIAIGLRLPDHSSRTQCDASVVTCALPGTTQYTWVIGVYSLRNKEWKTYGDFCEVGTPAFSPDGARIAFESGMRSAFQSCSVGYGENALLILDLASGQFTQVPNAPAVMPKAHISWSPDGRYLAIDSGAGRQESIVVIEVGSGVRRTIADGSDPSWSPKGDWIAYDVSAGMACMMMRPDGTDAKMVLDAFRRPGAWAVESGAVWSPDERTILLNEQSEGGDINVVSVDLETDKVTKVAKRTPRIFGWVQLPSSQLQGAKK
jgi:Tol biopolymer transport system component